MELDDEVLAYIRSLEKRIHDLEQDVEAVSKREHATARENTILRSKLDEYLSPL